MLNHRVEREIAAGLWLSKPSIADIEAAEVGDEGEKICVETALFQCSLLLQFLQFLWK